MPYCAVCGDHEGLNNRCNYCDCSHCQEHALPENHDCPGLPSNGGRTTKLRVNGLRIRQATRRPVSPGRHSQRKLNRLNQIPNVRLRILLHPFPSLTMTSNQRTPRPIPMRMKESSLRGTSPLLRIDFSMRWGIGSWREWRLGRHSAF